MSLNLVEELTQKKAPKFQVRQSKHTVNLNSINKIIAKNDEGRINLVPNIDDEEEMEILTKYLDITNVNYRFELNINPKNYEIFFKKIKGDQI
jgi:hypothetical protein